MSKRTINKVPRYFVPYTNDCFQNAYGALVSHLELNPNLILADYLSFMYDAELGYIGINYLHKPSTSFDFTEEELNTSLEYVYFPVITQFSKRAEVSAREVPHDKIKIALYIESDSELAHYRLKKLLDEGIPVITVVDLYYMNYHGAYKKNHGAHAVVVSGYNEEAGYVELFDKYSLSNSDFDGRIPIDEFKLARKSENPQGLYSKPIRNMWMEVNKNEDFFYNKARWQTIIEESCRRMNGEKEILNLKCGLNVIEKFRNDLLSKYIGHSDETFLMFKYYYSQAFRIISRSRLRFSVFLSELTNYLPVNPIEQVNYQLQESSKKWEIIAGLSLRLAATKKQSTLESISKHLELIYEYESCAINKLQGFVSGGYI